MKVKAIEVGYYGEKRRKPDEHTAIFTLKNVADFSPKWMRVVTATAAEKAELKKILIKRKEEAENPKPKRIVVDDSHLAALGVDAIDANDEEQFDELFDEEAGKEQEAMDKKREKQQKAKKARTEAEGTDHPADFSGVEGADNASFPAGEVKTPKPKAAKKAAAKSEDESEDEAPAKKDEEEAL